MDGKLVTEDDADANTMVQQDGVQEVKTQSGAPPRLHHFFGRGAVVSEVAVTAGGRPLLMPEGRETLLTALLWADGTLEGLAPIAGLEGFVRGT
jgi:hypothetical protein